MGPCSINFPSFRFEYIFFKMFHINVRAVLSLMYYLSIILFLLKTLCIYNILYLLYYMRMHKAITKLINGKILHLCNYCY